MPHLFRHTKVSTPDQRPTRSVRGLVVVSQVLVFLLIAGAATGVLAAVNPTLFATVTGGMFKSQHQTGTVTAQVETRSRVLGDSITNPLLQFNVPATFTAALTAAQATVTGATALNGPVVAGSSFDVSGVSTFNNDVIIEGNLVINQDFIGDGVTIDVGAGQVKGSNLIYTIKAGGGVGVSGTQDITIENTDRGSEQKIFKTIKVGDETFAAGSNTDTLTLAAGSGVTLGVDAGSKKVTITSTSGDVTSIIGTRDFTESLVLTDSQTVTASLDALNVAVGNRDYTGTSNLTSGQSLTASLRALDAAIATAGGHDAVTLAGSYDYLTLTGQQITLSRIDLTTDVTGVLPVTNGGTGASSLSNLIALGTHTTGNYVATIADAGSSLITVSGSGSENAAVTLSIAADSLDFTEFKDQLALDASTDIAIDGTEVFSLTNTGTGNSLVINDQSADSTPFVIAADGNVGIGTTTASQKLHVAGSAYITGALYDSANSAGSSGYILTSSGSGTAWTSITSAIGTSLDTTYFKQGGNSFGTVATLGTDDSNNLAFETNNATRMTLDTNGNLGIGTTNPSAFKLQVSGSLGPTTGSTYTLGSAALAWSSVYSDNLQINRSSQTFSSSAELISSLATGTLDLMSRGNMNFFIDTNNNGSNSFNVFADGGSNQIFTILDSGNVGIGTNLAPIGLFQVEGAPVGKSLVVWNQLGDQPILTASASGTTKFMIGNDGNVGIGTSTTSNAQLDLVNGGASALLMRLNNGTTQAKYEVSTSNVARLGTTTNHSFEFITNNSTRFKVMNGGNIGIASTNPTALLDIAGDASASGSLVMRDASTNALKILNGGRFDIQTSAGGDTGLASKFTLLNNGNVGIGTTAPSQLLDVNGSVRIRGNNISDSADTTRIALGDTTTLTNSSLVFSGTSSLTASSLTTFNCSDCMDFDDIADAPTLDANMTLSQSSNTWTQNYTGNTTTGYTYNSNSLTTASAMALNVNALTTGKGFDIQSTSTALTTGSLVNIFWNPGSATTATGDIFKLNLGANATTTGNLLALYNNSVGIFRVSTSQINSDVPHSFNAAGDVSIAYDIAMTNQTSSTIGSLGPLTISSGEAFENNDLNLVAYGTGKINLINSGLGLQTSEKIIFDTDDSGDSYLSHSNSGNYVSFFADGTEAARFKSDGSVDGNTTFNANAFDLAEYYPTKDATVEAGDVVAIAPKTEADAAATDSPYLVAKASEKTTQQVLGVVSTKPGFALGGGSFRSEMCTAVLQEGGEETVRQSLIAAELTRLAEAPESSSSARILGSQTELSDATLATIEDKIQTCKALSSVPIALAGRVPVKVEQATASQIKAGDLLMPSITEPGKAAKATQAGWVLGRALEDYKAGNDTVMTFVFITYYNGGSGDSLVSRTPTRASDIPLSDDINDILRVSLDNNNNPFLISYAGLDVVGEVIATSMNATSQVIAGNITIDASDNSITSIADTVLKLQTDPHAGNVDLFNGKLIFDTEGNIITLSDVQARLIKAQNFTVVGGTDDQGNAISSVGTGTLKAGAKTIEIANTNVTQTSKIFITPRASTKGQTLYVTEVASGKFTVSIDATVPSDISFDYWILGVQ